MSKKGIICCLTTVIACAVFAGIAGCGKPQTEAYAEAETILTLQVGNSKMMINETPADIDEEGTKPVIVNDRTLVPIRAIIEAMGGTVEWNGDTREVTLNYGNDEIRLVIDSVTAYLNDTPSVLDAAPAIINERTMLPIRFIAESFGFAVNWDGDTQTIIIVKSGNTDAQTVRKDSAASERSDTNILVAYFTAAENGDIDAVSEATVTTYKNKETGAAKAVADMIAEKTGADMFSIQTVEKFPTKYEELADAAKAQQDAKELPELAEHIENLEKYDTIFVVYPVWWYDMPQVMYSFFDEYDFSGKTIIPAITHEGSRTAGFDSIAKAEPEATVIKDGFAVASGEAADASDNIDKWLEGLTF